MLKRGDILDHTYQIIEEIGEGGAGVVYLAYHLRLQKKVVVKKIKDPFVGRINERGEADLLKQLHHTYLPQVYDFLPIGQQVFTVIQYIEGMDLQKYLNKGIRFEERQILLWLRQLCEVLEYLHSQEPAIIHSDIKPSNIMVTPGGDICLIDFNISFGDDSRKGISGFSERYASPEQILKSRMFLDGDNYREIVVDGRSDIYSLGITMYHVLTGIKPPTDYRRVAPLYNLKLPYSSYLINIVAKAMNPDIQQRYQSAGDMLGDIISIKTRDRDVRKLKTARNVIYGICGAMFFAGGILLYSGYKQMVEEHFLGRYENLVAAEATEDYESVINTGINILNDKKYASALRQNKKEKADILYMIANSYFEQDDYSNSIQFYHEAITNNQKNPEYFRDYAIALARNADIESAQKILDEAIRLGLTQDHIYLVQAEIDLGEDDISSAIENFQQAIAMTENNYLKSRAYILCARAYRENGQYMDEVRVLEEARGQVSSDKYLTVTRALGAAYARAANESSDVALKGQYNNAAIECYKNLITEVGSTFQDHINLAVLYEAIGEYINAESQLLNMLNSYADDYRVYMRLALVNCDIQQGVSDESKDYSKVKEYYEKASAFYQKVKNSGKSDDTMQYLEGIISELYGKGWL